MFNWDILATYIEFYSVYTVHSSQADTNTCKFTCNLSLVYFYLLLYVSHKKNFLIEGFFIEHMLEI